MASSGLAGIRVGCPSRRCVPSRCRLRTFAAVGLPGSTSPEAADSRRDLFNRIAPMYDRLNDVLSLGLHRVWSRMAVSWSRPPLGGTVLDVCCGSGDLSFLLAHKVGPNGAVTALDFSPNLLRVASERASASAHERRAPIAWVEGDALALPFPDAAFDAATMGYGLRNVADRRCALSELGRVLRPGATGAVLDFHTPSSPAVAAFQSLFLDAVVVPVATAVGAGAEYAYLRPSIAAFPTGPEQVVLARDVGFRAAVHYEIAGGLFGVLVATK